MPKKPTPSRRLFAALVDDDFGISRYDGAGTTTLGLFQALQRYSSFEEFHFFVNDFRKATAAKHVLPAPDRTRLYHVSQLPEHLALAPGYTVFFLPGFLAVEILAARDHHSRFPLPVCGLTYSLDTSAVYLEGLALQAYGCSPGDGLICTSRNACNLARALLTPVRRGIQATQPLLKVIPSGIHPEQFAPMDRSEAKSRVGLSSSDTVLGYFGRLSDARIYGSTLYS